MQDFFFFFPIVFNYLEEKEDSRVFGEAGAVAHVEKRSFEKVGATTHIGKERDAGFFLELKSFGGEVEKDHREGETGRLLEQREGRR